MIILWLAAVIFCGCAEESKIQVIPNGSTRVHALDAGQIVLLMERAGFNDEQIVESGTDLRNALSFAGSAQIKIHDMVEAIFVINDSYIYVTSRKSGNFIYSLKKKKFI
jgi:hypothetical protein